MYPTAEDCLFLNIYTPPANRTAKKLPVYVWIHGGSFYQGGSNEQRLNGTFATARDIVVVTLNYRLGIFGFLGGDLMRTLCPHNSSGNSALQDQRMALQWVQQHISAFGGDASQVFAMGQSAGAGSVSCHLVMSKSRGLMSSAGMSSGAFAYWITQDWKWAQVIQ